MADQEVGNSPAPAGEGRAGPAPDLLKASRKFARMVVITVFWCGITSVAVGFVARSLLKARDVRARFRTATGVVLSSKVKRHVDSDGATYEPIVRYRYTVNGREYVSARYAFDMVATSEYVHAAGIAAEFGAGTHVTVYYDPDEPGESVLTVEPPRFCYLLLLFLQPFVVGGLFLIGWTASLPGRARRVRDFLESRMQVPCRIPTWGELRHEMGGFAIQGGSRLKMVLARLMIGYAVTCFVGGSFAALLSDSFLEPDPRLTRAALLAAAGVGVLAGLLTWARPAGKARLHIDTALGRLSLTGRKRNVELSLSKIAAWTLRAIPNPGFAKDESGPAEALLLAIATAGGEEVPVHVFKADAEGMALAQKAAEGFAELTGKPVNIIAEPAVAGVPAKINIGDTVAQIGESRRAAKEYGDLT